MSTDVAIHNLASARFLKTLCFCDAVQCSTALSQAQAVSGQRGERVGRHSLCCTLATGDLLHMSDPSLLERDPPVDPMKLCACLALVQ